MCITFSPASHHGCTSDRVHKLTFLHNPHESEGARLTSASALQSSDDKTENEDAGDDIRHTGCGDGSYKRGRDIQSELSDDWTSGDGEYRLMLDQLQRRPVELSDTFLPVI